MSEEIEIYEGFSFGNEPEKEFVLHESFGRPGDTKQVRCAKCDETKLEVGSGTHFTIVRCPNCGHEACIHDG